VRRDSFLSIVKISKDLGQISEEKGKGIEMQREGEGGRRGSDDYFLSNQHQCNQCYRYNILLH
jgi:hypothetical protein